MTLNSSWLVLEESSEILGDNYAYPAMDRAAQELALEPGWFSWVAAINLFVPDSFTMAQFMRIFPYGLPQVNMERFTSAVRQGYMLLDGHRAYRATEWGEHVAIYTLFQAANHAIDSLNPMPDEALQRLVALLSCIVDAALAVPEPPSPFIMTHKRRSYERLGMKDSVSGFVAHYLELEGYRDDAYITVWQHHGLEGHTWETFDQLSHDIVLTFDELHEKTSGRGVTRQLHAEDVKELIQRGWVEESSGMIQITSVGRQVRTGVEERTKQLFFAPWSCLSKVELEDLSTLAVQLRDGLKK